MKSDINDKILNYEFISINDMNTAFSNEFLRSYIGKILKSSKLRIQDIDINAEDISIYEWWTKTEAGKSEWPTLNKAKEQARISNIAIIVDTIEDDTGIVYIVTISEFLDNEVVEEYTSVSKLINRLNEFATVGARKFYYDGQEEYKFKYAWTEENIKENDNESQFL